MTLGDAQELKDNFPEETEGFSIFEINQIWKEYSNSMEASWIIPNKEDVRNVFNQFGDNYDE